MFSEPGVRSYSYVSYMCSKYHVWFCEMGYPRLDLNVYEDGEYEIIEYLANPVVPSTTKWHRVLMNIRNVEISPWWCKRYTENLDLEKRHVWDEVEKSEKRMFQELEESEKHNAEFTAAAFKAVKQNDDLMNRIAKNGIQELSLRSISRHLPNHKFRKADKKTPAGVIVK